MNRCRTRKGLTKISIFKANVELRIRPCVFYIVDNLTEMEKKVDDIIYLEKIILDFREDDIANRRIAFYFLRSKFALIFFSSKLKEREESVHVLEESWRICANHL